MLGYLSPSELGSASRGSWSSQSSPSSPFLLFFPPLFFLSLFFFFNFFVSANLTVSLTLPFGLSIWRRARPFPLPYLTHVKEFSVSPSIQENRDLQNGRIPLVLESVGGVSKRLHKEW